MRRFLIVRTCSVCHGTRLRPEALSSLLGGKNIAEISAMSIDEVHGFLAGMELSPREKQIAERVVKEIGERLNVSERTVASHLKAIRGAWKAARPN